MLQERASQRPNIYQVHEAVCKLRGAQIRLENASCMALVRRSLLTSLTDSVQQKYAGTTSVSNGRGIPAAATGSSLASPRSLPTSPAPGRASPLANIITTAPSSQPPAAGSQPLYGAVPGLSGNANQIAPMRRGRPTKATASEDMQLLPERQVRTGMAALGGGGSGEFGAEKGGGTTGSWEAFGSLGAQDGGEGAAAAAASGAGTTASANGFADAFAPNSPVHTTSPRFPDARKSSTELETTVQLPSNIAMFAELSKSPNSETKPSDASSTAADNNNDDDDEERKRFESTFPDINSDFALLAPTSAPNQRAVPPLTRAKSAADLPESLVDVNEPIQKPPVDTDKESNKMPAQLTGERGDVDEAGPPLPRRPPSPASSVKSPTAASDRPLPNPKPTLVSRGSQTSPRLMADWKPLPPSGLGAPGSAPSPKSTESTSSSTKTSGLRQSSLPDSELFPATQADSRGEAVVENRKAVVDLLGDDLDEGGASTRGALGQGADSFLPMQAKPAAGAGDRAPPTGTVASKRMSFLAGTQPQSSASSAASSGRSLPGSPSFGGGGGGGEREKFRPLKRTSLGQGGAPPPVTSPKPITLTSPLLSSAGRSEAPDTASVEARFPDLSLENEVSHHSDGRAYTDPPAREKWEEVVEKDDEADSSSSSSEDDEDVERSARPSTTKVAAPSFDEDEAPTPRQSSSSTRPRFGENAAAAPSPSSSAARNSTAAPGTESRQQSFASTSSEGGGGIDLGPALASIHRFAPQGNQSAASSEAMRASPGPMSPSSVASQTSPPLPPAKSRSGSINSLVSRYEGRGLTGGPPPLGKKPVGLRKNSDNARLDGEGNSPLLRRDPVQPQKLPQWSLDSGGRHSPAPSVPSIKSPSFDEREETPNVSAPSADNTRRVTSPTPSLPTKPATPTIADRQPFKPIPPPGSPGGARNVVSGYNHAARPSFGGGRAPTASAAPASSSTVAPAAAMSDEPDERFAGVSNMKSRWESMAKARDADIQAARTRPRREHAAI